MIIGIDRSECRRDDRSVGRCDGRNVPLDKLAAIRQTRPCTRCTRPTSTATATPELDRCVRADDRVEPRRRARRARWPAARRQSCEDVVPAIMAAATGATVTQCFDAAPARISYRDPTTSNATSDVAVLCRGTGTSLFRVTRASGTTVVERLATPATRSARCVQAMSPATESTTSCCSKATASLARRLSHNARRVTPRLPRAAEEVAMMRRIVIVLALADRASRTPRTSAAERYFRAGAKAYSAQNFQAAATNFDEAYKALPMPEIAFSAAQAFRRLYQVEPKPEYVRRAVELYKLISSEVKTGGRVGDAADNLAEMKRELDKLEAAGVHDARRRGRADATRHQCQRRRSGDAETGALREIGDVDRRSDDQGLTATIDGKQVEPFTLVDVDAERARHHRRGRRLLSGREEDRRGAKSIDARRHRAAAQAGQAHGQDRVRRAHPRRWPRDRDRAERTARGRRRAST